MVLRNNKIKYAENKLKLTNLLLSKGKKSKIEKSILKSFKILKNQNINKERAFNSGLENLLCPVSLKKVKIAGNVYQVPIENALNKQQRTALRIFSSSVKETQKKNLESKLVNEFINASQKKGSAYKKKDQICQKAESNRAFVHYRW